MTLKKMEEILERLQKLKGVLLLDDSGNVYLLKEYESVEGVEKVFVQGGWRTLWNFEKQWKLVKYISSLEFSDLKGKVSYTYAQQLALKKKVNQMIDDRSRYLTLQRSLKKIGARITTQK